MLNAIDEEEDGLAPPPALVRRCVGCGQPNPRERAKYCRSCGADATRRWRKIRREAARSTTTERTTPAKPPARAPTEEQLELTRARAYVSTYVRRGKIEKKPCQNCGDPRLERIGPFHPKPAERLVFLWLCLPCAKMARKTTIAITRSANGRKRQESAYAARVAEGRDRARAAMLLIRGLDAPARQAIVDDIARIFAHFRWPARPHGFLYQDVARNVYEYRYGSLGVERARDTLALHGIAEFAEKEKSDTNHDRFFSEPTNSVFWLFEQEAYPNP
jgi:hypothetical protein